MPDAFAQGCRRASGMNALPAKRREQRRSHRTARGTSTCRRFPTRGSEIVDRPCRGLRGSWSNEPTGISIEGQIQPAQGTQQRDRSHLPGHVLHHAETARVFGMARSTGLLPVAVFAGIVETVAATELGPDAGPLAWTRRIGTVGHAFDPGRSNQGRDSECRQLGAGKSRRPLGGWIPWSRIEARGGPSKCRSICRPESGAGRPG
jgi:hypothetical protein